MIIYKVTHKLSGKIYIGQTTRTLKYRWAQHCRSKRTHAIHNAIRKYGKDAFSIEIVQICKNIEDLNNAEEYYINWYNCRSPNGYNLEPGGNNKTLSIETRIKIGNANRGERNGFFGKKHSEESRKRMSESQKGKIKGPHTEETKKKCSKANKGKHYSIKTQFKKGRIISRETRDKMSKSHKIRWAKIKEAKL